MRKTERAVRRGDLWRVEWEPHRGSEQGGRRPSLVVLTDEANEVEAYGNTVILAMSTTPLVNPAIQVLVDPSALNGFHRSGIVKCDQITTVSRDRLQSYIGILEPRYLEVVEDILLDILDLRRTARRGAF